MARFERRITEAEVSVARAEIAAGASLRTAAANIPCAPSTLSVRLKKATADGADLPNGVTDNRANGTAAEHIAGAIEPLDILRSALLATKPSGQPHWQTRLAAVRMLATLRPEEFERREEQGRSEPEVVVFDLEPGSMPVLHRPRTQDEPPRVSSEDAHPPPSEASPVHHMFSLVSANEETVLIGSWSPPPSEDSVTVTGRFHMTDNAEEAERWRAELSAGQLPAGAEDGS
jgi:hypothetical protein